MRDRCVLLIGHGSRDGSGNEEFEALAAEYARSHPELDVRVGYIELALPLFGDALEQAASSAREVVVVPVFLFAAGHVKNDIPLTVDDVRRRHPECSISVAPALGVHPTLVDVAWSRVAPLIGDDPAVRSNTLLLMVGRGASDPDANGDFCKVTRLVGEGRGLMHVESTFLGITKPLLDTSLALVARMRPSRLVVMPYLLFAGRLLSRLENAIRTFSDKHPWIVTSLAPHLGGDPRILALIDERASAASSGQLRLPCDTCQYRTALPGLKSQVGGLRALLYSVRHAMTHAQATMPVHTHRPLKKHVLVCGNADCVDRGSIGVLESIRREVKMRGLLRDVKITRTSCMGRCGGGPTVAVYPDGVWYRGVKVEDASRIVSEHLFEDRLVGELVDDIMQ